MSKTKPFAAKPIIPASISNAHVDIKSDRKTTFDLHYKNAAKNRDIELDIKITPGKQLEVIVKKDGAVIADQKFIVVQGDLANQKVSLKLEGPITGQIIYNPTKFNVDLQRNGEIVLQVATKILKKGDASQYIIKANSNNNLVKSALAAAKISVPVELKAKRKPGLFNIAEKSTGYSLTVARNKGLASRWRRARMRCGHTSQTSSPMSTHLLCVSLKPSLPSPSTQPPSFPSFSRPSTPLVISS